MTEVKHYTSYSGDTPSPDWTVSYGVDAFGRAVSRSETEDATTTDENYVYDGANVVLVLNDLGKVTERELYAPAVDAILASEVVSPTSEGAGSGQDAGTVNWMLGDNQGTIRDVAQASVSGGLVTDTAIVDHVIYSAYGVPTQGADNSSDPLPRFGFDGMRYDQKTGLNLTETRPYDPNTGGWLQPDPEGFSAGDSNLDRFVGNSPTDFEDPSGLAIGQYLPPQWLSQNPLHIPAGLLRALFSGGGSVPVWGCDCCAGGGYKDPSTAVSFDPAAAAGGNNSSSQSTDFVQKYLQNQAIRKSESRQIIGYNCITNKPYHAPVPHPNAPLHRPPQAVIDEYQSLGGPSFTGKALAEVMIEEIETLKNEIQYANAGKDETFDESNSHFTVVANAGGDLNQAFISKRPKFYKCAVEQLENDTWLSIGSIDAWMYYYVTGKDWNIGNSHLKMETLRTIIKIQIILKNAERIQSIRKEYPAIFTFSRDD